MIDNIQSHGIFEPIVHKQKILSRKNLQGFQNVLKKVSDSAKVGELKS